MQDIFLLLGSNLGDRLGNLQKARQLIENAAGRIEKASSVYRTAAWGKTDQPDFFNQALQLTSDLPPHDLLITLQMVEKTLGRKRAEKWGSRTMDIDILLYGDEVMDHPDLIIPHPLMHERRFALVPLAEIAPDIHHPVINRQINYLLTELSDDLFVEKLSTSTLTSNMNKSNTPEVDLAYLNDIAGGNAEFIIDMIDIFLEQTPGYFDQLSKAISIQDWKATGDIAHKIKPTLAFMGAEDAKEQMAVLERKARTLDGTEDIKGMFDGLNDFCNNLYISLQGIKGDLQSKM